MIPLVRARYSKNFIDVVREAGARTDQVFDDAGLTDEILVSPDGLTTLWQLDEVIRSSAIRTGNLDIGWAAAEAAHWESYGAFGDNILSVPTLFERLNTFCLAALDEYSEATFSVAPQPRGLEFRRGPIAGDKISARQTELYALSLMLMTVRSVLGPSWHPDEIHLQTFHQSETETYFDTSRTELRFDQPETMILIDNRDVARSLAVDERPDPEIGLFDISRDTHMALAEVVNTHLGDQRLSLEFIARICDMQPRTLQRMLARRQTTFSELLAQQRATAAMKWLKDSDMPIAELSCQLGYAHQAHFSRAFRRQTGLTPSAYRRTTADLS